ncbi:MAG: glycosyltransferase family 4 protein [Chloroflexota bacterium]|nr:glycosyltransferase family 4 protein [Chloroflexota bacterium]MDE3192300.1 glycosyltransferase family 4 protein [Chloroflexota bacterium]
MPRRCGIATFTADTVAAVRAADASARCSVIAIDEPGARRPYGEAVVGRIVQGEAASYRAAAAAINASGVDVVNVQHEFGLYGVHRGGVFVDHLVAFLRELRRPVVTTLHTVLTHPEDRMRDSVREIVALSTETVVMVGTAADLLRDTYGITGRVHVIPHGTPAVGSFGRPRSKEELGLGGRTVLCTFGLVDRRKGLEYAIAALPRVVARHPDALYLVVGQTHPDVVRREGEWYRERLRELMSRLELSEHVRFVDRYLTQREIVDHLAATDVYVTPYLDPDQITSGTLAYAMGAGKAIVSTPYLHAREALADGRGLLVPFRSAEAIGDAVNALLADDDWRESVGRGVAAYSAGTAWPIVGALVLDLLRSVAASSALTPA